MVSRVTCECSTHMYKVAENVVTDLHVQCVVITVTCYRIACLLLIVA